MDNRIFLQRYRLSRGRNGLPVELYRSPAACTYRAQEIETGREVALTLISPLPNDPALLERLEAEASVAEQINQINIPRLYDFGRENDALIYVTEYCEGHTAAAWVSARGPLAIGAVLRVALQVVDAMNATAFQRLHHSALNPENIVFIAGQTVEGDWPPIRVLHWYAPPPNFSETGNERIDSAVRFAAPEQLQDGQVDVRAEIYSLGATMWFLLTGVVPGANRPGDTAARAGLEKLRGLPKIVRHLLDRMLRVDPAERPQDPVALATYLQTCLARVERREKIERRLGVPLLAAATTGPRMPIPIPIKPLAWAAGILALAAFAVVFLPWPLTQKRTGPVVQETTRVPQSQPDEIAVVQNDSLGRMNEAEPVAAPVPATLVAALPDDEVPRDEMAATVASNSPVVEPAPPAKAPDEPAAPPTVVAATSAAVEPPAETILPAAKPDEADAISAPVIAENYEPREVAPMTAPPEPTPLRNEEPAKVAQSTPPAKKATKTALAKRTTKKSTVVSKSERTTARPSKTRRVASSAKRARPLPKLRVGSAQAELVGTTSDGKWILSVAESGQRVIVPPPPGYGD